MKGGIEMVPSMYREHLHLCRVCAEGFWVSGTAMSSREKNKKKLKN